MGLGRVNTSDPQTLLEAGGKIGPVTSVRNHENGRCTFTTDGRRDISRLARSPYPFSDRAPYTTVPTKSGVWFPPCPSLRLSSPNGTSTVHPPSPALSDTRRVQTRDWVNGGHGSQEGVTSPVDVPEPTAKDGEQTGRPSGPRLDEEGALVVDAVVQAPEEGVTGG